MRRSILVVEEDDLARQSVGDILTALGYRSVDVKSTDVALSALHGVWFDVVIVSPQGDDPMGWHVAREAKALQPHIKVIVVFEGEHAMSTSSPVDGFVKSPVLPEEIHRVLTAIRPTDSNVTSTP